MAGLLPPLMISSVDTSLTTSATTGSWVGITREPTGSGETAATAVVAVDDTGAGAPTVAAAPINFSLGRSGGHAHSRHRRLQSPHRGFVSSHFFLRRLHMRHPVCTLRIRALGKSPICWFKAPLASRGRQGRLRRRHRAHGTLPSQACLIWAQRWHTGRLSETMMTRTIRSPVRCRASSLLTFPLLLDLSACSLSLSSSLTLCGRISRIPPSFCDSASGGR